MRVVYLVIIKAVANNSTAMPQATHGLICPVGPAAETGILIKFGKPVFDFLFHQCVRRCIQGFGFRQYRICLLMLASS